MKKLEQPKKTAAKRHYSSLFKRQALERADKDGVAQAAKDLDITPSLIYNWRHTHAHQEPYVQTLSYLVRQETQELSTRVLRSASSAGKLWDSRFNMY